MNYLDPVRLHFAGRFQASVSTVNNDPLHFNNADFKPEYQELQTNQGPNGWWNPRGDAAWRLIGCRVTSAWRADGSAAAADDPVLQCLIGDSDRKVAAKLVDLDPEQQMVSQIWGLEVRVCTAEGDTLVRGKFDPAAFMDIWDRAAGPGGRGDVGGGAYFQSVLTDVEWAQAGHSAFLDELRARTEAGLLSIKFNVDGYNLSTTAPEFTRGRIVGTIGPASAGEPRHFVRGRQFMTTGLPGANFFAPAGKINFCPAVVDPSTGKVFLDLGNAMPTVGPGGGLVDLGSLSLACSIAGQGNPSTLAIGEVLYREAGWYEKTAGVAALPAGRRLSAQELQTVASNPLILQLQGSTGAPATAISESPGGLYVRADQFVFRLEPGETAEVRLFATRFGQPYAGARVLSFLDPNELQSFSFLGPAPPVAVPESALDFPARVVTDREGVATLPVTVADPGNPRGFIDGQVYGVRPALEETLSPLVGYPFSDWHFVSLLVFDGFTPDEPITWYRTIEPLLKQAANLYPVMSRFLDLGDYESVKSNRRLLELAFSLDVSDPNSMPVTRDLSRAKRRALLRWLADDPPLLGQAPPPASRSAAGPAAQAPPGGAAAPSPADLMLGSKSTAAGRRLGLSRYRRES